MMIAIDCFSSREKVGVAKRAWFTLCTFSLHWSICNLWASSNGADSRDGVKARCLTTKPNERLLTCFVPHAMCEYPDRLAAGPYNSHLRRTAYHSGTFYLRTNSPRAAARAKFAGDSYVGNKPRRIDEYQRAVAGGGRSKWYASLHRSAHELKPSPTTGSRDSDGR